MYIVFQNYIVDNLKGFNTFLINYSSSNQQKEKNGIKPNSMYIKKKIKVKLDYVLHQQFSNK